MTTTDAHGPVRASARVGAAPAPRPDAATLTPRRQPSHLGPVHVLQLVAAEAALLGLLAVLDRSVWVIVVVALLGLALGAAVLGRQQDRWWLERRVLAWRFQRRTKQAAQAGPAPAAAGAKLAALRSLAPRLTVEDVAVSDDSVVGVARDDAGWFAVAEITSKAAMADGPSGRLPLDTLVRTLTDTEQPGAALQVVTHTLGAPSLDLQPALPAASSYRELQQAVGSATVPADRVTWVAVRLDARALAEAGAQSTEHAPEVVAALLRKLVRTLRRAGTGVRILDRGGVLTALERSCDLQRTDDAAPQPREAWNAWHSAELAHRTYWVRTWPSVAEAGALGDWLAAVPASLTSVAYVVVPDTAGAGQADVRCLVRVAAPEAALAEVCRTVERGPHGAGLFPLDGEHGPAVYATAPTGGGPR